MRRPLLIAGAALLAGALLCRYVVADRWLPRIPPGWRSASSYVGTMTYPDSVTGVLPERDVLSVYDRAMTVVSDAGRPDSITVEDLYTIHDAFSGSVIWEYKTRAVVDPATGARLEPEYRGDYVVFPRNVQKGEYRLRTSYVNGIPLRYESTEKLDGLETYVFGYTGRGEYTESYAGSAEFAGIKIPRGQEIRCADDQFSYRVWVEPVTGAIVKLAEGCPSGDYVFDSASGKRLQAIGRWGGVTSGDALARQLAEVRHRRVTGLWAGIYGPLCLGGTALIVLAFGIRPRRRRELA